MLLKTTAAYLKRNKMVKKHMVLAIEPVVRGNVPSGRYGYDYHRYYYRGPGKRQVPCFAQAYHREADASSRAE
jgi:hypothetical protein